MLIKIEMLIIYELACSENVMDLLFGIWIASGTYPFIIMSGNNPNFKNK